MKPGCLPAPHVDGALVRRSQPFHSNPNPMVSEASSRESSPLYLSDLVSPQEIAGMEVYRSPAELPLQYAGTGGGGARGFGADGRQCGVILVWTR